MMANDENSQSASVRIRAYRSEPTLFGLHENDQ